MTLATTSSFLSNAWLGFGLILVLLANLSFDVAPKHKAKSMVDDYIAKSSAKRPLVTLAIKYLHTAFSAPPQSR